MDRMDSMLVLISVLSGCGLIVVGIVIVLTALMVVTVRQYKRKRWSEI